MDVTFISIHSLDEEAHILYSSDSVIDILGYTPDEIVNRSAWDFFPEEELPFARDFHQKRVSMDKAAVLAYCRVRHRDGYWVGCECCFTVVYDVMVVCTSIYYRNGRSELRALEAPIVRRLFSSSPRDPRYHMLTHISKKFAAAATDHDHEPRAALFLNRFTRTLTIMYATSAVSEIIGIPANDLRGRSFYYCIAENCLPDAVKCLENAKGNHSIAYLRFWFRDPRQDDTGAPPEESEDEEMTTDASVSSNAVQSASSSSSSTAPNTNTSDSLSAVRSPSDADAEMSDAPAQPDSRASSDESTNKADTHEAIFGNALRAESSTSSVGGGSGQSPPTNNNINNPANDQSSSSNNNNRPTGPIELEAVISCASDGLVVCLRRARPMMPHPLLNNSNRSAAANKQSYLNGLFAAPWAETPMLPRVEDRAPPAPAAATAQNSSALSAFAPSLGPQGAARHPPPPPPISASSSSSGRGYGNFASGPAAQAQAQQRLPATDFMTAIREQAVFAWALTGINGSLAEFRRGKPLGGAVPQDGLPVWSADSGAAGFNSGGAGGVVVDGVAGGGAVPGARQDSL